VGQSHEQEALNRGHALVPDRCHQVAARADHRICARLGQPLHRCSIASQAGYEVEVHGDKLAELMGLADERGELKSVGP